MEFAARAEELRMLWEAGAPADVEAAAITQWLRWMQVVLADLQLEFGAIVDRLGENERQ
jgi:hypothetical protein